MRAVIMAGGIGSRLQPITSETPKPMVKVLGKPVMEYAIEAIKKCEIKNIDITLRYLPRDIMNYFKDGSKWGVNINYHIEKEPLGTAGSVFDAIKDVDEDILILSGDAIFDMDLTKFIQFFKIERPLVAMGIKRVDMPTEFGVVVCEGDKVQRFIEKPNWSQVSSDDVNTGIYLLRKGIKKYDSGKRPLDFSKDVFKSILEDENEIATYNLRETYWCDIGNPLDYIKANIHYMGKRKSQHKKFENMKNIISPCFINKNVSIDASATIGENVYIEDGCKIGRECVIKNSVILNNCKIRDGVHIDGSIICEECIINNNCILEKGAIIGNNCEIDENCLLQGETAIWPHTKVPSYSIINSRVDAKSLKSSINTIDNGMISGRLSLSECSSLGYILGNIAGYGNKVAVGHIGNDPQALCIMSGIIASGANCVSVKGLAGYLFGRQVKSSKCRIGAYVCEGVEGAVYLLDEKGRKISSTVSRKIKDAIKRNTITNIPNEKLGKVISSSFSANAYAKKIEKVLKKREINEKILSVNFAGAKNIFNKRCFRFLDKYESNSKNESKFKLTIVDGGISYSIEDKKGVIDFSRYDKKAQIEKDAFLKAVKMITSNIVESQTVNEVVMAKIIKCPQIKKGSVMKSLYKKYGDSITVQDEGINIQQQTCSIDISPHETSPIINVKGKSDDESNLTLSTNNMVTEIENTINKDNATLQ